MSKTSTPQTALSIGDVTAEPGTTARGQIPVGRDALGREVGLPVIVVHGRESGPRLWLNGAIHGDEPEGTYSIFLALAELDPMAIRGSVIAIPSMNPGAFAAGTRGNPLDTFSYDMNRIYPGKADGYPTERIAAAHWAAMQGVCDLQISIHSGGEHSYLGHMIFSPDDAGSFRLAAAMGPGWTLVFKSATGGANPSSLLAAKGIPAISVELGGNCRTLTKDFREVGRDLAAAYLNVMRHFGMLDGSAQYAQRWRMGYQIALLAPVDGMFIGNPDLAFETALPTDYSIGVIVDLYGDKVAELRAPQEGVVFGLRSRPSVLAGAWCCFFGVIDEERTDLLADPR